MLRLLLVLTFLLAASCHTPRSGGPAAPPTVSAPSRVSRSQVLGTAMAYANHVWTPRPENVRHGRDRQGIQVDTPDTTWQKPGAVPGYWHPGRTTSGIPYQWGGFCTPEEFDRGLAAGLAAGDVYTSEKRRLLEAGVSQEAVGIDCSGFVSRCWNLPRAYSTRELEALCDPLPSFEDLRPGDALNIYNAHVILFCGWLDAAHTHFASYETGGPPDWFVTRHTIPVTFLRKHGYRPVRYRGIAD